MKKLFRVLPVAMAAALMVPAFMPTVASASPVDQQRQRVEDIVDELERLEQRANQIGEEYVEAIDAKSVLDDEIVLAAASVAAKEAEIDKLRGDLGEMAIRSFVGAGSAPLGPLFEDASDLTAIIQRDELARVALSAGTVTTDELNEIVADLESERAELGRKRTQADQLASSLLDAQSETERLTGEYVQARADAEATLGQLVAEEEARRAAATQARVQAEYAASQAANNSGGGSSSNNSNNNSGGGSTNSGGGGSSTNSGSNNSGGSSNNNSGDNGGTSTPTPTAPPPAVSSRSGTAINAAMGQIGVPYRYATSNPGVSFDCSGLTAYAWGQAGVYLPHQSRAQYASIPHVDKGAAQPGDLLFYYSPISHVGVYLGGGQLVHAPNTGSFVNVANVNWGKVSGVGRPG